MTKRFACPECGNTDPKTIESNGASEYSDDLTLCCMKFCTPDRSTFDEPIDIGDWSPVWVCGMQWTPNSDEGDMRDAPACEWGNFWDAEIKRRFR